MGLLFYVLLSPVVYLAWVLYRSFVPYPSLPSEGKTILISGCDTGFGNLLARRMDKLGYKVLAGCFTDAGQAELRNECSSKIVPFKLDITKAEDVANTVELVKKHANGKLWGLVNNAGISAGAFIEWNTPEVYQRIFAVNYFGHVNMTKAHIPFLVAAKGRIVNITSSAALIAADGMAPYASTKFALEGFSDSLRREMYQWGVKVSIIQPAFMKTPIVDTAIDNWAPVWNPLPQDIKDKWGQDFYDHHLVSLPATLAKVSEDPILVIEDIQHALTNSYPYFRYHPGFGAKVVWMLSQLPAPFTDFILRLENKRNIKPAILRK